MSAAILRQAICVSDVKNKVGVFGKSTNYVTSQRFSTLYRMSRLLEAAGAAVITHPCVDGPVHWERDEGCCWSVTEQAMKRRLTMLHVPSNVYRILNCYTLREKLSSVFRISSALSIVNERY